MRKRFFAEAVLFVLVLLPLLAGAAGAAHPQLYFSSADVAGLKAKVAADPYRTWFAGVQQLAVETPFPNGPSLAQDDLGNAAVALRTNAFVYAVNGDTTYGLRAKGYLLKACTWPYWQDADRIAHGQTVSYMSGTFQGAVAETYDWIYPLLTAQERATVQQAMVAKSLQPLIAQHGTDMEAQDFDTNRIVLAQGGVGLAAIALKDDLAGNSQVSSAATIVHDTLLAEYFNRFDRDGAWNEGIGYLSFGLANDAGGSGAIYYAEALRRATGENLFMHPKFSKSPEFLVYFFPPDRKGESSAFGDENFGEAFRSAGAAALASRTGNAYAQWYYKNAPLRSPDPIGDILFTDTTLTAQSPDSLPLSRWFRDAGWAAMRTGWDTEDTLVGFKSGPFNPGNDRPEQNSFFLDALGERLVILPGVSTQGYSDSSYWTWYRATIGQNTIMLDKDADSQVIHPPDGSSVITRFLSSSVCDMTQGSAAPVYKGKLSKFTRDLIFVKHDDPGYLIVYDDLAATRAVEFDFLLHGLGSGSVKTNTFGIGTISITRPTARLYAKVVSPDSLRYTVLTGKPTDIYGANTATSYVRVAPATKVAATRFLGVLYPLGSSEAAPTVTDISGTSYDGVTVKKNAWEDTVLLSTAGGTIRYRTITSDGRMVLVSDLDGELRGYGLQDATTLTVDGARRLTSTKPVTVGIHVSDTGFDGTIQAPSAASVTFPSEAPREVRVNGVVTIGYTWNSAARTLTFSLPAGDTVIQVTFSGSTPPPNPSPSPSPTPTPIPPPPPPPEPGLVTTTETATTSSYLGYSSSYIKQAQSVKSAGTGVEKVAVALARKGSPTIPITVRLRSTLKGADLATATITPVMVTSTSSSSPEWVEVYVGRQGILTAGSPLYVVLDTGTYDLKNYYYVPLNSRNPYANGNHYRGTSFYPNSASDMLVKVW
ncbi:MAG: heparinase II/III family protein, partial [Methanomicrobiales archaeon]|nr:heparinase II/III family protein [Methanomicrobiales archaeon]